MRGAALHKLMGLLEVQHMACTSELAGMRSVWWLEEHAAWREALCQAWDQDEGALRVMCRAGAKVINANRAWY